MGSVEPPGFAPADFDDVAKPHRRQEIGGRRRGDDGHVAPEAAQRAEIEMIHVRVGQQNEVERRQLARP